MRLWVYSLLVILISSCAKDILAPTCPAKCYGVVRKVNPKTEGVGVCRAGKPICDENFNIIRCVGEILPSEDVCDGLDNDCDGSIDLTPWGLPLQPSNDICFKYGECSMAAPYCHDGAWDCGYPNTVELGKETRCDGLDNDCDGLVDESLFESCEKWDGSEGPCTCYSGPVGSSNFPCRSGFIKCIDAQIVCLGEVTPSAEMCDGIDNNCDGLVDNILNQSPQKYDIVLAIDQSGSMCFQISAVLAALNHYISQFSGSTDVQFAVITMTDEYNLVEVMKNFSDISIIISQLQTMGCTDPGFEASYDAIYKVCDINNNVLNLNWRNDATHMYFGFTDEPAQSYEDPALTEVIVGQMCKWNDVYVYQWSRNFSDFDYICSETNGQCFPISADEQHMFNDLDSIISKLCTE